MGRVVIIHFWGSTGSLVIKTNRLQCKKLKRDLCFLDVLRTYRVSSAFSWVPVRIRSHLGFVTAVGHGATFLLPVAVAVVAAVVGVFHFLPSVRTLRRISHFPFLPHAVVYSYSLPSAPLLMLLSKQSLIDYRYVTKLLKKSNFFGFYFCSTSICWWILFVSQKAEFCFISTQSFSKSRVVLYFNAKFHLFFGWAREITVL